MTVELTKILTNYAVFAVIWYVLQTFGYFRLLRKTPANKAFAFIPVVRELVMFKLVWKSKFAGIIWFVCAIGGLALFLVSASTGLQIVGWLGLVMMIASIVIHIKRSRTQSKAFNLSGGITTLLIFVNPIGNIVIGMGQAEYKGAK